MARASFIGYPFTKQIKILGRIMISRLKLTEMARICQFGTVSINLSRISFNIKGIVISITITILTLILGKKWL